jgi:hypothetical protein
MYNPPSGISESSDFNQIDTFASVSLELLSFITSVFNDNSHFIESHILYLVFASILLSI